MPPCGKSELTAGELTQANPAWEPHDPVPPPSNRLPQRVPGAVKMWLVALPSWRGVSRKYNPAVPSLPSCQKMPSVAPGSGARLIPVLAAASGDCRSGTTTSSVPVPVASLMLRRQTSGLTNSTGVSALRKDSAYAASLV